VNACRNRQGPHSNLNVVQGDVYQLPFQPEQFDFVYCLGVLQHTPDVEGAFMSLPAQVRPGGRLAVHVYPKMLRNLLWSKYWLRPVTKRMQPDQLFRLVQRMVNVLLPWSLLAGRIPLLGRKLRYLIPVANYEGRYPLNRQQVREWAILD